MRQQMWPAAEHALKRMLVIERVAEMEALHATPAELDQRIDEMAERLGRPRGEVIGQLRKKRAGSTSWSRRSPRRRCSST
jgi:FKBP-type peptidyl-prolyl cis-trans isomerase (trigger factor)